MLPSTPSRSPCSWSSCDAVFSPMPGTPGMLSEVSPFSPHEVGDQLGRDAVAVDHGVAVVHLRLGDPAARGHHPHARLDQLEQVAVAGHDHHVDSPSRAPGAATRGDHVVGLVALHAHVLVAERVHERLHVRPLLGEQVGLRVALRLVLLVDLLAARHARRPRPPAWASTPYSEMIFTSIEAKPKIAFVGCPLEVAIDSGSAKNAR